jgi:hypothetical protein
MVLAVLAIGAVLCRPGVFTVDESHYLLAAEAFAERGGFHIPNGYEETGAEALLIFYTLVPARVAELGTVSTVPPYHAVLAAPFFLAGRLGGLVWLNLLAFAGTLLAVRRLAARAGRGGLFPWATAVVFALATFGLEYALGIWPHALSQCLMAWVMLALVTAASGQRVLLFAALAGLLGGLATGVRLQNVLLLPVLLMAGRVWLQLSYRSLAVALGGWLLPLAGLAAINAHRLQTANPFSYGASASWALSLRGRVLALLGAHPWIPILLLAALIAAWWLWRRTRRRAVWWGLGAGALLVVTLVPVTRGLLLGWLASLGFHLVDTAFIPGGLGSVGGHTNELGQVLYGGVLKKGLLEAAPWLALGTLALLGARLRPALPREVRFLAGAGLVGAVLVPLWVGPGGLCFNPRYLLEITPALAIVALTLLAGLAPERRVLIAGALGGVLAALPVLLHAGDVHSPAGGWLAMLAPIALAVAAPVVTGIALVRPARKPGALSRAAALLAMAGVAYAALVHLRVDLARSLTVRDLAARICAEGLAVIPEPPARSVLLVAEGRKDAFSPLKLERDVWIAKIGSDEEALPDFVRDDRVTRRLFALRNGIPEDRWRRWFQGMQAREEVRRGLVFVELAPGGPAP